MKKIKLEVVVEDEVANEVLEYLQELIIKNVHEYNLSMEEYGIGPILGECDG